MESMSGLPKPKIALRVKSLILSSLPPPPSSLYYCTVNTTTATTQPPQQSHHHRFHQPKLRRHIDKKHTVITQRKLWQPVDMLGLRQKLSPLCKSHHASLVKLHGASVSGNYIYLVYDHIHGATLTTVCKTLGTLTSMFSRIGSQVQIVAGVADGLDNTHNSVGINPWFIHDHIQSSSIVVTDEPSLRAKIFHFGNAPLCSEVPEGIDEEAVSGRLACGWHGAMAWWSLWWWWFLHRQNERNETEGDERAREGLNPGGRERVKVRENGS